MQTSLVSLQDIIKEAWRDIQNPETNIKDRHNAMHIRQTTETRLGILG
ncbi:MAG: hypothetical protein WBX01_04260 [Nitrososphaeraceae archaeon]